MSFLLYIYIWKRLYNKVLEHKIKFLYWEIKKYREYTGPPAPAVTVFPTTRAKRDFRTVLTILSTAPRWLAMQHSQDNQFKNPKKHTKPGFVSESVTVKNSFESLETAEINVQQELKVSLLPESKNNLIFDKTMFSLSLKPSIL